MDTTLPTRSRVFSKQPLSETKPELLASYTDKRSTFGVSSLGDARCTLRARARITSHFRIPSSGHLQPLLNRKILDIAVLCLRSCSIVAAESDPNLGAKNRLQNEIMGPFPGNLFLRKPLVAKTINTMAFGCRSIPAGCVARRLNTPGIRPPRALPAGRLGILGASPYLWS